MAKHLFECEFNLRLDVQIQCYDAVAARCRCQCVGVDAALCAIFAAKQYRVAVAKHLFECEFNLRLDVQIQGYDAVAARDGCQCVVVGAALRAEMPGEQQRIAVT